MASMGGLIKTLATPKAMREASQRMLDGERCWHVVHNVHEAEKRARECIKRAGFDVYYPQVAEYRAVPRRFLSHAQRNSPVPIYQTISVPVFPRYVFVRFSIADPWHDLFAALRLMGVLCAPGQRPRPYPFPAPIVDAIKSLETGDDDQRMIPGSLTLRELGFAIGDAVRILSGPFAAFCGTIEQLPDEKLANLDESVRVKLLVSIFGQETPVELPLTAFEKL